MKRETCYVKPKAAILIHHGSRFTFRLSLVLKKSTAISTLRRFFAERIRTMPRRTDIHSILIIGSGPIVIGQGCEFDYSGVQACRALKEEGYRVVLINSNPATIMTDPEFADATYIEPITPEAVEKILAREAAAGT